MQYLGIRSNILLSILAFASVHRIVYGELDFDWNTGEEDEAGGLIQMESVLGKMANLPCNIDSPFQGDHRVYMVLWFKENTGKPLYSFDVRGRSFNKALHWSDVNTFGPRATFVTVASPAHLQVENIQLRDEGIYRCRVDFRNAPTRNFQINLTVIVPPHQLIVYDNSGREVSSMAGPLTEGSNLHLTCEVRGGKPPPKVSWYIDNTLMDSGQDFASYDKRIIISKIEVTNIRRSHLNNTFCCQATNTELIKPHRKSFILHLYLRPISVRIVQRPTFLLTKTEYTIACETIGSIPDPQITWWKRNKLLSQLKVRTFQNASIVTSEFSYIPEPDDNGHALTCRAENLALTDSAIEDTISLNVLYAPSVSLHFGSSLDPENIKEGDDVYFECRVRCNPSQHKIHWYHNGQLVLQNVSSGVIVSTQSLVLQGVTYRSIGNYSCHAINEIGESTSKLVHLDVKYAPRCLTIEPIVIGASLEQALHVLCRVIADPDALKFSWQFNNTAGESFKVSTNIHRKVNNTISELTYKPSSELDYGTLICWAENSIGRQVNPCTFHIVPAVKQSGLENCTAELVIDDLKNWLKINCIPTYEEDIHSVYHLDIVQAHSLLLNLTSLVPTFYLDSSTLDADHLSSLHMYIYSTNIRGKSKAVLLTGNAFRNADKRTEIAQKGGNSKPLNKLTFVIGCVIAVAFAMIFFSLLLDDTADSYLPMKTNNHSCDVAYQLITSHRPDLINTGGVVSRSKNDTETAQNSLTTTPVRWKSLSHLPNDGDVSSNIDNRLANTNFEEKYQIQHSYIVQKRNRNLSLSEIIPGPESRV